MPIRSCVYERAALILDCQSHALGELSLALISLGLRPLYTTELDELVLLSREYRSQVGAVLLPGGEVIERLPELRKLVLEPLGMPHSAVVPIGNRLPAEQSEALRSEGVRFWLREPFAPHELRFVVAKALSDSDPDELRIDPRVPCDVPVSIESEHRRIEGRLSDVSVSGAFVAVAHPHAERTKLRLEFSLRGQPCHTSARVAWRTGPSTPSWCDVGMGVEFVAPDDGTRALLRRAVAEQLHRFRL